MKKVIRLTELDLHKIVQKSIKNILCEDHQNLPLQSAIDYLNSELHYLTVWYNPKTDALTIESQEPLGLADASVRNSMSSYFETLSDDFKIIEKYTMNNIGFEDDGVDFDESGNAIQNMNVGNLHGQVTMDEDGTLNVHFEGNGNSNHYSWGHKINNYDKTNYDNTIMKPSSKMYWSNKYDYDKDAKVDNRDPNKKFKAKLDKQWADTQDKERYTKMADTRPLHRKGSLNRTFD